MSVGNEGSSGFEIEAERARYEEVAEFHTLEALAPDALEMVTSLRGEEGLTGQAQIDYWDNIGKGQDGFYDSIRKNGCSSCGSFTPGCCDGCA